MITILPNELEAVAFACSTDNPRYYLEGIFFELFKDGNFSMVATDGHRMNTIRFRRDEKPKDSFILALPDVKRTLALIRLVRKFEGRAASKVRVFLSKTKQGKITISVGLERDQVKGSYSVKFNTKPLDGTFPDYRKVIPSGGLEELGVVVRFNAQYVKAMCKVSELLWADKFGSPSITIHSGKVSLDPVVFSIEGTEFLGVLMPMKRTENRGT